MGYSYAADMINKMKHERSRYAQNKKRSKSINASVALNNKKQKKLNFKKVTPEKMTAIKVDISNKLNKERKKNIFVAVIAIIIAVFITFKIFKFIFQ